MKILVPLILVVAGAGAGVGAGVVLRPDADAVDERGVAEDQGAADVGAEAGDHAGDHGEAASDGHGGGHGDGSVEYVKMGNQFIVPILEESRVRSLVVLSVDLEVAPGRSESVYRAEPRLRDSFLTVLFDHANAGGFEGRFTSSGSMDILRRALREAGQKAVGRDVLSDVLITNIVRQDA